MRAPARGGLIRPSISPLLWMAVAAWLASLAGSEVAFRCWLDGRAAAFPVAWAIVVALCATAVMVRRRSFRPVAALCALVFALAVSHGAWAGSVASRLEASGPRDWTGTVAADARSGTFGTTVEVRLDAAPWGVTALVVWPSDKPLPAYGSRVVLSARMRALVRQERSADAFRRGTVLRATPWRVTPAGWADGPLGPVAAWRARVNDALCSMPGGGAELLGSMLLGTPATGSAARALEDARTAGVAWAVTSSGMHLAALVLAVGRVAGAFGAGRNGRAAATVVVAALIACAAGLRLSLIRAALAAAASALARVVGRRRDATAALGAGLLVLVVPDPTAAFDVGLLLGALALSFMAVFGMLAQTWLRPVVGRAVSRALGASAAAQCGVAPLSATLFGGVALLGPMVLVVTTPLAGAAACLGMAGGVLLPAWQGGAKGVLVCGSLIASAAAAVWAAAARLPGAFLALESVAPLVWVAWVLIAGLVWLKWPRPRRAARVRFVAGAVASLVMLAGGLGIGSGSAAARIEVLDVGQGDAILVRDGGHALLVDTGADPVSLRRALARAGIRSLDGVVLTHAHDDHTGGLPGLAGVARPAWIGVPDVEDDAVTALESACAPRADSVIRLRGDMVWTVGAATTVRVLWPRGGERLLDTNDTSVVLLVEADGGRALLLGDAEDRAQQGVLEAWPTRVDMVKVAHHGSPNGNVPAALAVWAPARALISVGEGNRFGHPSALALETLEGVGARIERTDLSGDLTWVGGPASSVSSARRAPVLGSTGLCDNRSEGRPHDPRTATRYGTVPRWLPPTSATSSPSTSSTAPRSCCSSARSSASATGSRPSRTWTSTSRRSMAARPPPTRWSTPPTRCRS